MTIMKKLETRNEIWRNVFVLKLEDKNIKFDTEKEVTWETIFGHKDITKEAILDIFKYLNETSPKLDIIEGTQQNKFLSLCGYLLKLENLNDSTPHDMQYDKKHIGKIDIQIVLDKTKGFNLFTVTIFDTKIKETIGTDFTIFAYDKSKNPKVIIIKTEKTLATKY